MGLFPGHLRALGSQPDAALAVLLSEYNDYPPFLEDCHRVKAIHIASRGRTRQHLAVLARRWNLDRVPALREMHYQHLLQAVEQTGERFGYAVAGPFRPFGLGRMIFSGDEPTVVWGGRSWEWHLSSQESLAGFRDRIAVDLGLLNPRLLPPLIVDQLRAAPLKAREQGWLLSDIHHELATQVRWLFLRLCPQPDQPWSARRIVQEEWSGSHERTVRRVIVELAELMRIDLPYLSPGRPLGRRSTPDTPD